MKNKVNSIIYLFFILFLVGFGYILYDWAEMKREVQKYASMEFDRNEHRRYLDILSVFAADNSLFEGKREQALEAYRKLLSDTTSLDAEFLHNRMAFMKKLEKPEPIENNKTEESKTALNDSKEALTDQKKTQTAAAMEDKRLADSLENRIAELNRKISTRDRALKEKEQLRAVLIKSADGSNIHYVGDTRNGMANGKGTGVWEKSGGTYTGDWVSNKRHGYGVYTWKDGVKYEGDFRNDKREGKGAYYWLSGERYVGQWKDNQRNGSGVLFDKDGNISYEGHWQNDRTQKK